jgi:hypothetical protein
MFKDNVPQEPEYYPMIIFRTAPSPLSVPELLKNVCKAGEKRGFEI